jgi:hypothetical protein
LRVRATEALDHMLYCISVNDIQQDSKPAGVVNVVNVAQAGNWPEKKSACNTALIIPATG